MFSPSLEELCALNKEPVKYGELVVLGYNGSLPNGDRGRRKSRFALYKRPKASGVKPSTVHVISTPQASKWKMDYMKDDPNILQMGFVSGVAGEVEHPGEDSVV